MDAKSIAPEKPFFLYYAPGACHAPHHAPKEWIDKYKGRFDMGYEAMREQTLARQKELGLVPKDTELPPINPIGTAETRTGPDGKPFPTLDVTRPWDSLSDDEKTLFCRMAEVYAGFLAHADDQIGRLLDFLEEFGWRENTIVILVSDNGASGEGGPNGSVNEMKFANGIPDTIEANLPMLDELGGPKTYNHYPNGWAMAFNTPFKMWKRYEFNGGTSDPCIISWPAGMKARGEIRDQYHHAIDIVPTILDVLGVEPPDAIKGHVQSRVRRRQHALQLRRRDGADRRGRRSSTRCSARGRSGTTAGRPSRTTRRSPAGATSTTTSGSCTTPRSTARSCTTSPPSNPDKVRELLNLWFAEAGANGAFPLDDRSALEIMLTPRPVLSPPRDRYIYFPDTAEVPESQAVNIRNRSFAIGALVDIPAPGRRGRALRARLAVRRPRAVRQGQPAALRLQLRRHVRSRRSSRPRTFRPART